MDGYIDELCSCNVDHPDPRRNCIIPQWTRRSDDEFMSWCIQAYTSIDDQWTYEHDDLTSSSLWLKKDLKDVACNNYGVCLNVSNTLILIDMSFWQLDVRFNTVLQRF